MTHLLREREVRSIEVVEEYLGQIGRGDLAGAKQHLAPDATIVFPGGHRYSDLQELVEHGASRYVRVDKDRDEYHAFTEVDDQVMVVSIGRLYGRNLAGIDFRDIRYVDIFRLRDGRIVEQRVWNDLAASGVLSARTILEIPTQWRGTVATTEDD